MNFNFYVSAFLAQILCGSQDQLSQPEDDIVHMYLEGNHLSCGDWAGMHD